MLHKVIAYIQQKQLLSQGDRIVAGVSGGADSICLLHVLLQLRREYDLTLQVVHINHGLRGEEAERDERFVREFCASKEIACSCFYYDVRKIAKEEGMSEEEAGRKVRYEAFLEYCREHRCNKLAIAHNKNDNAETFLFHLFRGSGITGLSGMESSRTLQPDASAVTLIRPLLCVTREEIEEYLAGENLAYIIDSSNLTDKYSRNRIRNRILNYASKEINVQSVGNIIEAANTLKDINEYLTENIMQRYDMLVREEERSFRISSEELKQEHIVIQKGLVRRILEKLAGRKKDLEAKHVEAVLSLTAKQVGKQMHLPYDIIAEREYNDIIFYREAAPKTAKEHLSPAELRIPGRTLLPQRGIAVETVIIDYKKNETIPKSHYTKWFDYDKIENAVQIRTRKEGDYIQINALGGRKKLKDYFIDHKIPREDRDNQLLITDGSHIMWIPGLVDRMSEGYKVDAATRKVLLMSLINLEEKEE